MHSKVIQSDIFKKGIINAGITLRQNKELVDALNVFPVPDGDTGTNMSKTMDAAVEYIVKSKGINISELSKDVAKGSLMGARGNSGVILSQLFRGFGKGLENVGDSMTCADLAEAFDMAAKTAYNAVMKPTEGTILTVAREMAEFAVAQVENYNDIVEFFEEIINEGERSVLRTPELLPVLKEAGVVDAGGKGLVFIYKGFLNAVKGIDEIEIEEFSSLEVEIEESTEELDLEFLYCTGFILNTEEISGKEFTEMISPLGNSLVLAEGDGFMKVHIHSNEPGTIMQMALKYGELTDINIDNMKYQHDENKLSDEENHIDHVEKVSIDKEISVIAVSMGEGITSLFDELGVDYVINGGQTMNPSTEDFMKAIGNVTGEKVILLPNNSNIILAAKQAAEMSDREVFVVESKTVPQGIASMLDFDEEVSAVENFENMKESIQNIITGQVTYAVRNTNINGVEINENDIIGLKSKEILSVSRDIDETTIDLIDKLVDEDSDLITLYYGSDIEESKAEELLNLLEEKYSEFEFELVYGGQPIYYYLISVE